MKKKKKWEKKETEKGKKSLTKKWGLVNEFSLVFGHRVRESILERSKF